MMFMPLRHPASLAASAAKFAVTLAIVSGLAACGGGRGPDDNTGGGGILTRGLGGRGSLVRGGLDANAAYTAAVDFKAKGDYKNAVLKLRPVANLGPGYENAQTALGECLLEVAGSGDLSSDYLDGMTWLRRAADGGWPDAQIDLAQAHVTGPTAIRNGEEAAYWLALYDANPGKSRVGFVPMDPAAIAAIRAKITPEQRAAGERRAALWERKVWLPPTPANGPGLNQRAVRLPGGPTG